MKDATSLTHESASASCEASSKIATVILLHCLRLTLEISILSRVASLGDVKRDEPSVKKVAHGSVPRDRRDIGGSSVGGGGSSSSSTAENACCHEFLEHGTCKVLTSTGVTRS